MSNRPDPKDETALQLIEVTAESTEPIASDSQTMFAHFNPDALEEWLLNPVAAEFSPFDDTADLPPGSSFIMSVDPDLSKIH